MAEVDFHTGVADKLGYTCRLLRKAWRAGKQVVVTGAPDQLARLDSLLWTFDPGDFIPHARLRAGEPAPDRLVRTPIWLADAPAEAGPRDVLVNLGPAVVADHARYARIIEIVAEPADEVASGRQRWRHYLAAGLTPTNHAQRTG
ncbi:MAG: DNA polymerase III subunit chi [Aquabacterium sp.]|nr:DNA polymerase III subunit chi [Aquabacterium sp.]